jgi:hypothetical protein
VLERERKPYAFDAQKAHVGVPCRELLDPKVPAGRPCRRGLSIRRVRRLAIDAHEILQALEAESTLSAGRAI